MSEPSNIASITLIHIICVLSILSFFPGKLLPWKLRALPTNENAKPDCQFPLMLAFAWLWLKDATMVLVFYFLLWYGCVIPEDALWFLIPFLMRPEKATWRAIFVSVTRMNNLQNKMLGERAGFNVSLSSSMFSCGICLLAWAFEKTKEATMKELETISYLY